MIKQSPRVDKLLRPESDLYNLVILFSTIVTYGLHSTLNGEPDIPAFDAFTLNVFCRLRTARFNPRPLLSTIFASERNLGIGSPLFFACFVTVSTTTCDCSPAEMSAILFDPKHTQKN
ncbi:hypothetical protein BLOT_010185 [Blomia tropicalis]|nr:hypothetical protein BLOT_010185 [Blomia tropicalis]